MRIHITATTAVNPSVFAMALRREVLGFEPGADVQIRAVVAPDSRRFQAIETDGHDVIRDLLCDVIEGVRETLSEELNGATPELVDLGREVFGPLTPEQFVGGGVARCFLIDGRWRTFISQVH